MQKVIRSLLVSSNENAGNGPNDSVSSTGRQRYEARQAIPAAQSGIELALNKRAMRDMEGFHGITQRYPIVT